MTLEYLLDFEFSLSQQWKSTMKRDHAKKFPWNQLFSNFFSKLIWRKKCCFLRKNSDQDWYVHSTVWKNDKFTLARALTEKFFRQINYLVIYLVLLSRNFF